MNLFVPLIFVAAAGATALLTAVIRHYALTRKIGLAIPRARDLHTKPIPRLGGVAISLVFIIVTLIVARFNPAALHFIDATWFGFDRNFIGIIAGVVLLMIVGAIDDIRGLQPATKLIAHIVAGIILAASLVLVPHISNPFGGVIDLGYASVLFVIVWVVVMINVINFLDGLDGLASGMSLIATIVLYLLAIKPDVSQLSMSLLAVILGGTLVGFLPFNFFPAKIFLGDSGSQVLGFLLAVFSIISGGKLATAFLVLGVPILDIVWVVGRRWLAHQPVYQADTLHIHHRLIRAGLSQRQAVLLLYTLSAAFGIVALQTHAWGKLIAIIVLLAIMVGGGAILVYLGQRGEASTQAKER